MRKFARKILTKLDKYEDFGELNEDTVVVCNDCGAGFLRDDNYYTIQNSDEAVQRQLGRGVRHGRRGAGTSPEFTKGKQGGKKSFSEKRPFIVTTTGNTKTDTHDFTRKWIDNSREGLILNYTVRAM